MTKTKQQLENERHAIRRRRKNNLHDLKLARKEVDGLEDKVKDQAKKIEAKSKKIREQDQPLRLRAFAVAEEMLGVVEVGGNNTGPVVNKIIRANGGVIGEPWCGDFVAYCYRDAGSQLVDRAWASVNAIESGNNGDFKRIANPARGDVVTFSFSHTGLFDKWIDRKRGIFRTIEGNTGSFGAVSDSLTGGDGVYRKDRSTSLGVIFWRVAG